MAIISHRQETFSIAHSRGFALLIAIIFMAVMLAFGLALGSLAYKQQVLASSTLESSIAFYTADGALECAILADQKYQLFDYQTHNATDKQPTDLGCNGSSAVSRPSYSYTAAGLYVVYRLEFGPNAAPDRCADVTILKPPGAGTTQIFAQGYDTTCAIVANPQGARFVSRGLSVKYTSN